MGACTDPCSFLLVTGRCARCGENVVGEGTGCTAMDQVFHVECFTCMMCKNKLRGQPFYAVEKKAYCEPCYIVSTCGVFVRSFFTCRHHKYLFSSLLNCCLISKTRQSHGKLMGTSFPWSSEAFRSLQLPLLTSFSVLSKLLNEVAKAREIGAFGDDVSSERSRQCSDF